MLKIYGASDDLVEIDGPGGDEIDCYSSEYVLVTVGTPEGGMTVKMRYAPGDVGVWTAEISQLEEDIPIPWPVRIEVSDRGYSVVAVIDCPDGTPVSWKASEPRV